MRAPPLAAAILVLLLLGRAVGQEPVTSLLTGGEAIYEVKAGDSLALAGARFGVDFRALAEDNELEPLAHLRVGQELRVDNRHLVPQGLTDGILVNIPQRMLFFFRSGRLVRAFPVGLGRPDWPTPIGKFKVLEKKENKTWLVPKSIQEEMLRERKLAEEKVPPGPENPLGRYWLRFTTDCGIHGTLYSASVFRFETHGCIRLRNEDIAELYPRVEQGMPVIVIYEPILLGRVSDTTFLEVHPDVYRLRGPALRTVQACARATHLDETIDWRLVERVVQAKAGVARKISR